MVWVCNPSFLLIRCVSLRTSADMSKPVYRHLAEQQWRTNGALDLLVMFRHLFFNSGRLNIEKCADGTRVSDERCPGFSSFDTPIF